MTHPAYKPGDLIRVKYMRSTGFRNDVAWEAWCVVTEVRVAAEFSQVWGRALYFLVKPKGPHLGECVFRRHQIIPHRKVPPEVQAALMRHHLKD